MKKQEDQVFIQLDLPTTDLTDKLKVLMDQWRIDYKDKAPEQGTLTFGLAVNPCDHSLIGERAANRIYKDIFEEQKRILREYFPTFPWNQTYLHCNWPSNKHKDNMPPNVEVLIIGFGDYEGGDLVVIDDEQKETVLITKNRVTFTLGGRYEHYNQPITKGYKYSFCVTYDIRCPPFGMFERFS